MATVNIPLGANIASIINNNPGGTTYQFAAGTYRQQSFFPHANDTLNGDPGGGTIISGAIVLSSWTQSGSNWVATGLPAQTIDSLPSTSPLGNICNDLWVTSAGNTVWYPPVGSISALAAGRCFFDSSTNSLYIRDNPAGLLIEYGVTDQVCDFGGGGAQGVTLNNLTVEKYLSSNGRGAVSGVVGWNITNCTFRFNHGAGLGSAANSTITSCRMNSNGFKGFGPTCSNTTVTGCEIAYNLYAAYDNGGDGGGTKCECANLTFRNCYVHDNRGNGIWADVDSSNWVVDNCYVANNLFNGIMYEISHGPNTQITNNTVVNNGQCGIFISNSDGVTATGNKVWTSTNSNGVYYGAISVINDDRFDPNTGERWYGINDTVTHNQVVYTSSDTAQSGTDQIYPYPSSGENNVFDFDTYYVPNGPSRQAWHFESTDYTWTTLHQQTGYEANGTVNYSAGPAPPAPPVLFGPTTNAVTALASIVLRVSASARVSILAAGPSSTIFFGIAAWAPSTFYFVGDRRSNGGNAYQCIQSGTASPWTSDFTIDFGAGGSAGRSASSGGPTGTGSAITDGTVVWKYLAHIDYVSLSTWASAIPTTLAQPYEAVIWDCGPITTPPGVPFFTLTGHGTSPANTITIRAASGESIRDLLATGSVPLSFDFNAGVRFELPGTTGNCKYVVINDQNVVLDGLQFVDQNPSSNSSLVQCASTSTNVTLRNCIFDGYAQTGGAALLLVQGKSAIYNCLIVDRQGTSDIAWPLSFSASAGSSAVTNCTVIGVNGNTGNGHTIDTTVAGVRVRNTAVFGYAVLVPSSQQSVAMDHCGTSVASLASPVVDNGGNILGLSATGQFVDAIGTTTGKAFSTDFSVDFGPSITGNDWRLKAGSRLISTGTSDTTDIPSADDIARHQRVGWDIGAWEFSTGASGAAFASILSLRAIGSASVSPITNRAQGGGILMSAAAILLGLAIPTLGSASLALRCAAVAANSDVASTSFQDPFSSQFSNQFGPISQGLNIEVLGSRATAVLTTPASCAVSLFSLQAASVVNVQNASAQLTIPFDVAGTLQQNESRSTILRLSCVASATPVLLFSGLSTITNMSGFGQTSLSTNASAADGIMPIASAGSLGQRNSATGSASFFAISLQAATGPTVSASTSILPLSSVSTVGQANGAFGSASLLTLFVAKPAPVFLQSDAPRPLTLLADGTGLALVADVSQPNLTSSISGSGLATIPSLSASGLALFQVFASSVVTVLPASAAAVAQQVALAAGSGIAIVLRFAGTMVQQLFASARVGMGPLAAAVATAGQADGASGSATVPALRATAALQGVDAAAGSASITIAASATASFSIPSSATASFGTMAASAAASFRLAASGTGAWQIASSGALAQSNAAAASASIQIGASVIATQRTSASAAAAVPAISCQGVAVLSISASASGALPSLVATGTAVNMVNMAQASATIMGLQTAANSAVFGSAVSCNGTIVFGGSGTMAQEVEAAVLIELEQIVASHARLWTTPIGYVPGDDLVYWPD